LSQIFQGTVPQKYYLSRAACLGIVRRANARGRELPPQLKKALEIQAGLA
jgi:DNA (cytosine-5)-methyltransferase 1